VGVELLALLLGVYRRPAGALAELISVVLVGERLEARLLGQRGPDFTF
jgi:hypothetical protein